MKRHNNKVYEIPSEIKLFNNNKEIYCIYDNKNIVIPQGSKASPTDFGKENFEKLLKNCCFRKE